MTMFASQETTHQTVELPPLPADLAGSVGQTGLSTTIEVVDAPVVAEIVSAPVVEPIEIPEFNVVLGPRPRPVLDQPEQPAKTYTILTPQERLDAAVKRFGGAASADTAADRKHRTDRVREGLDPFNIADKYAGRYERGFPSY
jgi:hypothetical protein